MSLPVPFLWLCGPSGVGKSTVGYEIYRQLIRAGRATAYVDADQLGLCYPPCADDRNNHRIKARNLGAVWAAFRVAGADSMILSGGVESAQLVRSYADRVPGTAVTLCRLRAGHDTLTDRFVRRGWMPHLAAQAVAEADDLDRLDFAGLRIDTDGRSVAEVARLVRDRAGAWPSPSHTPVADTAEPCEVPSAGPVPVLFLCGPTAVGKSTVGYEIFTRILTGTKAAYVDLAQIGFCAPAPADDPHHHRLKAANLAAMWPAFHDAGARCLVVTGRVDDAATIRAYAAALPAMALTVCRLHAGREALADRVLRRGRGGGPGIPGDELKGRPPGRLHRVVEQAAREADDLHRARIGDLWVDTDGLSVEDVTRRVIVGTAGWPHLSAA